MKGIEELESENQRLSARVAELEKLTSGYNPDAWDLLRKYAKIVSASMDMLAFIDTRQKFEAFNEAFLSFLKVKREDVIGQTMETVLGPEVYAGLHDDLVKVMNGQSLRTHCVFSGEGKSKRICEMDLIPCTDDYDHFSGIVITARDLTERIENDLKLQSSEFRLAEAQKISQTGSWEWNIMADEIVWSDNIYALMDSPIQFDETYEGFLSMIHDGDRETVRNLVADSVTTGNPYKAVFRVPGKGGGVRWIEARGQVNFDSQKRPIRMAVTIIDISKWKQAEEEREALISELEKRNSENERFIYTVSHDLKTPLVTISGFVRLLEGELGERSQGVVKDYLSRVLNASNKMRVLLDELLKLSRVGFVMDKKETVSMELLAREAFNNISEHIEGIQTRIEIQENMPSVHVDPNRLREVWTNLLDNAVKFREGNEDVEVSVGCRQENEDRIFYVRDNGIGIEDSCLDKIFGMFNRLHPEFEGHGVGLAVVKRIIEKHGGRIWAESDGPGKGAGIFFTVPG